MEFVVTLDDDLLPDTMEFTFDDVHEAMLFAMMAKAHTDNDAMVNVEVLMKGDEEDED